MDFTRETQLLVAKQTHAALQLEIVEDYLNNEQGYTKSTQQTYHWLRSYKLDSRRAQISKSRGMLYIDPDCYLRVLYNYSSRICFVKGKEHIVFSLSSDPFNPVPISVKTEELGQDVIAFLRCNKASNNWTHRTLEKLDASPMSQTKTMKIPTDDDAYSIALVPKCMPADELGRLPLDQKGTDMLSALGNINSDLEEWARAILFQIQQHYGKGLDAIYRRSYPLLFNRITSCVHPALTCVLGMDVIHPTSNPARTFVSEASRILEPAAARWFSQRPAQACEAARRVGFRRFDSTVLPLESRSTDIPKTIWRLFLVGRCADGAVIAPPLSPQFELLFILPPQHAPLLLSQNIARAGFYLPADNGFERLNETFPFRSIDDAFCEATLSARMDAVDGEKASDGVIAFFDLLDPPLTHDDRDSTAERERFLNAINHWLVFLTSLYINPKDAPNFQPYFLNLLCFVKFYARQWTSDEAAPFPHYMTAHLNVLIRRVFCKLAAFAQNWENVSAAAGNNVAIDAFTPDCDFLIDSDNLRRLLPVAHSCQAFNYDPRRGLEPSD